MIDRIRIQRPKKRIFIEERRSQTFKDRRERRKRTRSEQLKQAIRESEE